jgi:hypothetical protein
MANDRREQCIAMFQALKAYVALHPVKHLHPVKQMITAHIPEFRL